MKKEQTMQMKEPRKWRRVEVGNKESWLFNPNEIDLINNIYNYLKKVKSCPITHLYKQDFLRKGYPHLQDRIYVTKYCLMFLWKRNKIRISCNNGMKLIRIRKQKIALTRNNL